MTSNRETTGAAAMAKAGLTKNQRTVLTAYALGRPVPTLQALGRTKTTLGRRGLLVFTWNADRTDGVWSITGLGREVLAIVEGKS